MKSGIYTEILNECDRFAKKEVRPRALEADMSADQDAARLLWQKSRELDLPALLIPEKFTGVGLDPLIGALVLDRLAMECAGFASVLAYHFAACAAVSSTGTAGAEKWFSFLAGLGGDQSRITSICIPSKLEGNLLLVSSENSHLVINGSSPFMGNTRLADTVIVFAGMDEDGHKTAALRVDLPEAGVLAEEPLSLPGLRINAFARLSFDNVRVETDAVLATGDETGKMIKAADYAFYGFVAAMAMGCARSAFQKAKDYAGRRYQFKKMIIYHQEIQRLLGDMHMKLNTGTTGYLDLLDGDKWRPPFLAPKAPLVKAFCTDAALDIVIDAIQIHGGYGYMHEYGLEKYMRDVKVLQVLGETNPYLLVRHIADNL